MNTKVLSLVVMFALGSFAVFAGEKTEKIEVNGNCGMCKTRIEKAAKSLKGVSSADWDSETKIMEVSYDDIKASTQQIQTAIAMAGHDTDLFSANDKKYAELPGCCQYQRNENRNKMNHEMKIESNQQSNSKTGSCCGKTTCDK
jgi:copper chaperone CopZ